MARVRRLTSADCPLSQSLLAKSAEKLSKSHPSLRFCPRSRPFFRFSSSPHIALQKLGEVQHQCYQHQEARQSWQTAIALLNLITCLIERAIAQRFRQKIFFRDQHLAKWLPRPNVEPLLPFCLHNEERWVSD